MTDRDLVERAAPRPRWALAGATSAAFALHAVLALVRRGPVLFADEAGYLGAARVLSGGQDFYMGSSPFYRSGYSLLLFPVQALGLAPPRTYTLVLLINAALAAALLPLLYLLVRRAWGARPRQAIGAAVAGAAYPSVTTGAEVATPETLLFVLLVLWLLAFLRFGNPARRATACDGFVVGACAAVIWAVHGRMVVIAATTVLTVVCLAAARRLSARTLLTTLVVLVVGHVLSGVLDARVIDLNYAGRRVDEVGATFAALDGAAAVGSAARGLLGAAWYLLVATFGLVGVAVPTLAVRMVRQVRERQFGPEALAGWLMLTVLAGLLVVSSLWLVDATRPDHLVYGRYAEPVVPPLLAAAVALLGQRPRWSCAGVAVLLLPLAGVVAALRAGATFDEPFANRWSGAGLPFPTMNLGPSILLGATVVAVLGGFLLLAVHRRRPSAMWVALVALFLPVIAFSQLRLVATSERGIYPAGWTDPEPSVGATGEALSYDLQRFDRITIKVVQHYLPTTALIPFDGAREQPPSGLVLSGAAWPQEHPDRPATEVWRDPGRDQVVWQLGAARTPTLGPAVPR